MTFNFDIAAIIGLGTVAATLFWRLMSRIESKVDYVVKNMTTKAECEAHRKNYEAMFNGHDHTKEGDLVVIRRPHGPVHQETEGVPGSSDATVTPRFREGLGKTL